MNPWTSLIETKHELNVMNFYSEVILDDLCVFCKNEIKTFDYFGNGKGIYDEASNAIKLCIMKKKKTEQFSLFCHKLICEECSNKSKFNKIIKKINVSKEHCNIDNCDNHIYYWSSGDVESDETEYYCTTHTKRCESFDCAKMYFGENDLCELHRHKVLA